MSSVHPLFEGLIQPMRPPRLFVEVPKVEVEQTILALMAAAEQIDQGRPAELGSSLLAHQLFASIKGLNACLDR